MRRDRGRDDEGASGDRPRRATRSGWCREQGLYPAELDAWKQDAIAGLGEPRAASAAEARQDRRRVKELERELHRKDKVLAETAALLVLSKKLSAVFHQGPGLTVDAWLVLVSNIRTLI